jgi:hypothetical protein
MRGRWFLWVPLWLALPGTAQGPKASDALTVSGRDGSIPVVRVGGKPYVSVEALARLTGGSATIQANGILLTLPAAQTEAPGKKGYSLEFLKAAIEEVAAIREWRVAVMEAVEHGYPFTADWFGGYRRTAETRLALVSTAAGTDADKNCAPLVSGEFGKMQRFTDKYLATRTTLTYVSPDTVDNDPDGQQILNCARGLESLPAGGEFQDIVACH